LQNNLELFRKTATSKETRKEQICLLAKYIEINNSKRTHHIIKTKVINFWATLLLKFNIK